MNNIQLERRLRRLEETVGVNENLQDELQRRKEHWDGKWNPPEVFPGDDRLIKNSKWWKLLNRLGYEGTFSFENPKNGFYSLNISKAYEDLEFEPNVIYTAYASKGGGNARLQRDLSYVHNFWNGNADLIQGKKRKNYYKQFEAELIRNVDEFISMLELVYKDAERYDKTLNR